MPVRVASAADLSALVRLNREVQQLHAELQPTYFKSNTSDEEVGTFFAAKLALSEHHFRLSEDENGPNGYIWFEMQERSGTPFTLPRRHFYIHHLAVQYTSRRLGVASALLSHAESEARAAGLKSIALDVWAANELALSFFVARGFAPCNLVLAKSLT